MDDDDLDFSAWTAPPAPSGLADRVLARVAATDEVIAGVVQRRRSQRRWWIAGGIAAVLAGAAIALVTISHGGAPSEASAGSGTLTAAKPEQLALPGAIANVDPGGAIQWQVGGDAIYVHQRSGAATWRVDQPRLVLDVGAAVASIEASNATLRVETRMNLSDVRVVGAAALTSAAVALVTVTVYEGQAKLSGAGQTVVVQPGVTFEVGPGQPPRPRRDEIRMTVGGTPPPPAPAASDDAELVVPIGERVVIHDARGRIAVAIDPACASDPKLLWIGNRHEPLTTGSYSISHTCDGVEKRGTIDVLADAGTGVVIMPKDDRPWTLPLSVLGAGAPLSTQISVEGIAVAPTTQKYWLLGEVTPKHSGVIAVRIAGKGDDVHYYIRRDPGPGKVVHYQVEQIAHGDKWGPLSVGAIDGTMKAIEPALIKCIKKRSDAQLLHFDVNPDGTIGHLYATIDDPVSNACVVTIVQHTRFPKAAGGTSVSYSLAPPCDADKLIEAGTAAIARGAHAEGLKSFEAALDCKYDDRTLQLSFMAACSAGDVAAARRHWKVLTTGMRGRLLQLCLRNHITQDQLDE